MREKITKRKELVAFVFSISKKKKEPKNERKNQEKKVKSFTILTTTLAFPILYLFLSLHFLFFSTCSFSPFFFPFSFSILTFSQLFRLQNMLKSVIYFQILQQKLKMKHFLLEKSPF